MDPGQKPAVDSECLARRCVAICEDRRAENVMLFDVRETSVLADFYLICSATSEPHVRAISGHLTRDLTPDGFRPQVEGTAESHWVVIDFGDVLVHVMLQELREFYRLEELWTHDRLVYRSAETRPGSSSVDGS